MPVPGTLAEKELGCDYSIKDLAERAYQEGFRFRKSKNKIPVATLHKILRKLIYTGEFEYGGKVYQGTHEPLISRAVWDRCQEILDGRLCVLPLHGIPGQVS